jgi:hypothetical protein
MAMSFLLFQAQLHDFALCHEVLEVVLEAV